jgi:hypothetical protein
LWCAAMGAMGVPTGIFGILKVAKKLDFNVTKCRVSPLVSVGLLRILEPLTGRLSNNYFCSFFFSWLFNLYFSFLWIFSFISFLFFIVFYQFFISVFFFRSWASFWTSFQAAFRQFL